MMWFIQIIVLAMIDLSSSSALALLLKKDRVCFSPASEWSEIDNPYPIVASTTSISCLNVASRLVRSVEPYQGKLNGSLGRFTGIYYLPPRQAQLLRTGKPLYSCHETYSDTILWLSYNRHVGKNELASIYSSPNAPSPEQLEPILKSPDVFTLVFDDD